MKKCPFSKELCNNECALFIDAAELNELVRNRLRALGVFNDENNGICSLKGQTLAQYRYIFENTTVYNKN